MGKWNTARREPSGNGEGEWLVVRPRKAGNRGDVNEYERRRDHDSRSRELFGFE